MLQPSGELGGLLHHLSAPQEVAHAEGSKKYQDEP